MIDCSVGLHLDKNVSRSCFCGVSDFAARRPSTPKDAVGDHGCPAAAAILEACAAIFADTCADVIGAITSVCSVCVEVVVCTVDELGVTPDSSFRILALNLVQDSLNVLDSGVLTVGELTSVLILVVVLGVLVLTVVVLVVVLVTGVVAVDELEHTHDDGTGLGAGHGLFAVELAVGHAHDDAGSVAGHDGSGAVLGDTGPIFDLAGDGVLSVVRGAEAPAVSLIDDVLCSSSHIIAIHGFLSDGQAAGHVYVVGSFQVRPVPGCSGRLGLLRSFNLIVVEGASEHGDELDAGDLVIGSERAVLETGYDA